MEYWIDPVSRRIMAKYSGLYTGRVWQDLGYERYEKLEPWMLPMLQPEPEPPKPTEIIAEDGSRYVITPTGALKKI